MFAVFGAVEDERQEYTVDEFVPPGPITSRREGPNKKRLRDIRHQFGPKRARCHSV